MFDRDLILDKLDSLHHQAQNFLFRFKARVIERCADRCSCLRSSGPMPEVNADTRPASANSSKGCVTERKSAFNMGSRTLAANQSPGAWISERFQCYRPARQSYSALGVIIWRTAVPFVFSIGIRRRAKRGSWKITVLNTGFISSLQTCLADSIVPVRGFFCE